MDYISEEDAEQFLNGDMPAEQVYEEMNSGNLLDFLTEALAEDGFQVQRSGERSISVLNTESFDQIIVSPFREDPPSDVVGIEVNLGEYGESLDFVEWRDQRAISDQENKIKSEMRTLLEQNDIEPE